MLDLEERCGGRYQAQVADAAADGSQPGGCGIAKRRPAGAGVSGEGDAITPTTALNERAERRREARDDIGGEIDADSTANPGEADDETFWECAQIREGYLGLWLE